MKLPELIQWLEGLRAAGWEGETPIMAGSTPTVPPSPQEMRIDFRLTLRKEQGK